MSLYMLYKDTKPMIDYVAPTVPEVWDKFWLAKCAELNVGHISEVVLPAQWKADCQYEGFNVQEVQFSVVK